jgi:tetratricopeptide (TPR) repeat protein
MEFTRLSGASGVGAGTLDHLHAVIVDLDQAFYTKPLPEVFGVARAYRRRVQELIQGRHTLAEGRELFVCAGWLDERLAWVARNLGDSRAAQAYAIDCFEHAEQAGHAQLCGYAAQVMASVPMDVDQPERAVDAIRKGVAKTPSPSHVAVWVRAHAAEIHARLGQRDESAEMLRQAGELYDRLPTRVTRRFSAVNSLLTRYDMLGYAARRAGSRGLPIRDADKSASRKGQRCPPGPRAQPGPSRIAGTGRRIWKSSARLHRAVPHGTASRQTPR